MSETADPAGVLSGLQARWSAAFNAEDWRELASLYHPEAHLFGGRPDLYSGRAGVLAYFESVAPGAQVTFRPGARATPLGTDCIVGAAIVDFRRHGTERLYRMSWTLAATADGWRIASHHASPVVR